MEKIYVVALKMGCAAFDFFFNSAEIEDCFFSEKEKNENGKKIISMFEKKHKRIRGSLELRLATNEEIARRDAYYQEIKAKNKNLNAMQLMWSPKNGERVEWHFLGEKKFGTFIRMLVCSDRRNPSEKFGMYEVLFDGDTETKRAAINLIFPSQENTTDEDIHESILKEATKAANDCFGTNFVYEQAKHALVVEIKKMKFEHAIWCSFVRAYVLAKSERKQ